MKVIILNPVDSAAIVPSVKAANRAGIPVITVDRSADGGKAHPGLKGVFAQNDEMALGAVKAAKQAGAKLVIVGFDAIGDALAAIKAGDIAGTVAQQPALMGTLAVR